MADDLRFVIKKVVGEENFIDMTLTNPTISAAEAEAVLFRLAINEERRNYGRIKFDQIKATKADYVVTPCHNCMPR